jgi:ferritin
MITKQVEKAVNEQIQKEEHSSRIYLAMASWCERNGFPGAGEWLYAQADEERMHMLKLVHYLNDRGGNTRIAALDAPPASFKSLLDVFQQVLRHEEYISASINKLYEICLKAKDFTSGNFLQWYITEQIEEESNVRNILDQIGLVGGGEKGGLFHIDKELSAQGKLKAASLIASATGAA